MTSMREKIARAICTYMEAGFPTRVQMEWGELSAPARAAMFARADAVLDALMEPTSGMELAGGLKYEAMWFENDDAFTGVIFTDMGAIFRAMIQAARDGA